MMILLDGLMERYWGLQRGTGELKCALGDYATVRTISVRLRKCGFTQSSTTEVLAGGEHQGGYLDRAIDELREKPNSRFECDSFTLESAYYKGRLRIINNRRLYCPQKAMRSEELSATRHLSRALVLFPVQQWLGRQERPLALLRRRRV